MGLRMELHRKCAKVGVIHAFAGVIIQVYKRQLAAHFIQSFCHDCIAMVLAGDIAPAGPQVFYRLVAAAVTVFQLGRLRTGSITPSGRRFRISSAGVL